MGETTRASRLKWLGLALVVASVIAVPLGCAGDGQGDGDGTGDGDDVSEWSAALETYASCSDTDGDAPQIPACNIDYSAPACAGDTEVNYDTCWDATTLMERTCVRGRGPDGMAAPVGANICVPDSGLKLWDCNKYCQSAGQPGGTCVTTMARCGGDKQPHAVGACSCFY